MFWKVKFFTIFNKTRITFLKQLSSFSEENIKIKRLEIEGFKDKLTLIRKFHCIPYPYGTYWDRFKFK